MGRTVWRSRAFVLVSIALLSIGCGTRASATHVLASCLRQKAGAAGVNMIATEIPGASRGMPRASVAVGFETGGPTNSGGVIAEIPVNTEDIYVFADALTARRAAVRAGRAVAREAAVEAARARDSGNPTATTVLTSANQIGRSVLVYIAGTAFGSGQPISAQELGTVRTCLSTAGYG